MNTTSPTRATNATINALGNGLRRGRIELGQSMRSRQDQTYYLFMGGVMLVYLFARRHDPVDGVALAYPAVALPGLLAGLVAFNAVIGPGMALAMEREDGTLLRAKAVPHGMVGHVTGQVVLYTVIALVTVAVILAPALVLFDDVAPGGIGGWVTMAWVIVLGLAATVPIGLILGSLVPSAQKVGAWGMVPGLVILGISGIFHPLASMWGWLQAVAQTLPVYWMGLGLRSAFLPDDAAAVEIDGSWRPVQTALMLGAWTLAGLALAPAVLRRMVRRQSGSHVERARRSALQIVK